MAQFMISVFHQPGVQSAGAAYGSEEDMQAAFAAVTQFNADLQAAGQWVYAGSLTPPESAITVDSAGPVPLEPDVTPGPFSVAAAALGGFWIIEAVNQAAALERATQASAACGQKVELRALEG